MDCTFIVPPPSADAVVRDYAGGLGFEAAGTYVLPPLDLLQLAAIANPCHRVDLQDLSFARGDSSLNALPAGDLSDHTVIVQVSLPSLAHDVAFARRLRTRGARVLQRIQHLSRESWATLEPDPDDEWLVGECEEVFVEILAGGRPPNPLDPKACTPPRPKNLDALPFPLRKLARGLPYHFPRLGPCTTLLSARGCPFQCRYYCPYPLAQGTRWRARSAASVVEEVEQIVRDGLATRILFRDAVFTLNQSRAQTICRGIRAANIPIRFWCETRADLLDEETVRELAASGCVGVNVGVETGDEELRLRQLKSGVTDDLLVALSERLRRHGIQLSLLMMVGWPGESRQSLVRTGELIGRLHPCSVGFAFPTAYAGTDFHRDLAADGHQLLPLPTSGSSPQVVHPEMTSRELIQARDLLIGIADAAGDRTQAGELVDRQRALTRWASVRKG